MADQSAGRVSLHPCFPLGLWTASTEITGEGDTPALFCLQQKEGADMESLNSERSLRASTTGTYVISRITFEQVGDVLAKVSIRRPGMLSYILTAMRISPAGTLIVRRDSVKWSCRSLRECVSKELWYSKLSNLESFFTHLHPIRDILLAVLAWGCFGMACVIGNECDMSWVAKTGCVSLLFALSFCLRRRGNYRINSWGWATFLMVLGYGIGATMCYYRVSWLLVAILSSLNYVLGGVVGLTFTPHSGKDVEIVFMSSLIPWSFYRRKDYMKIISLIEHLIDEANGGCERPLPGRGFLRRTSYVSGA